MKKKSFLIKLAALTAVLSLVLVSGAQAGTIANITVTPTTPQENEISDYKIEFGIVTTGATTTVELNFPSGFNVAGVGPAAVAVTGITQGLASTTVSGQVVTLTIKAIATTSAQSVTLTGIRNHADSGSGYKVGFFAIGTATDTASSSPFVINQGLTSADADTTRPVSKITNPASGATLTAGQAYTITGTGTDNASVVSKVEVSVDGGSTWAQATVSSYGTSYNWSYVWANPTAGDHTIKVRATDSKNNVESPGPSVSVTVEGEAEEAEEEAAPAETPAVPTTASELQAKIAELQQQLINLLNQLLSLLTQQLQGLIGGS